MAPLFFASSKQFPEETKMAGSSKHPREFVKGGKLLKT